MTRSAGSLAARSIAAPGIGQVWIPGPGLAAAPRSSAGTAAGTQPTTLVVRVIAKGGKFLGDDIGGARVVVREVANGAVLASVAGGSGDTAAIMTTPRDRATPIPTTGASEFSTVLELDAPTLLEVTAEGPLGGPPPGRGDKGILGGRMRSSRRDAEIHS